MSTLSISPAFHPITRPQLRLTRRGRLLLVVAFLLAALGALSSWSIAGLSLSLGPDLLAKLFHSTDHLLGGLSIFVAESVGFEPTVASRPQRFSRPSHSSTLATLRVGRYRSTSRRCEKNPCTSPAASSARTPLVTAMSWCSRGSTARL